MSAISNVYSDAKEALKPKIEQAQICLSGKYRSFVDWTAQNSFDVKSKLAIAETDCKVKKAAKVALTLIASFILLLPALMVSAYCSGKNFICKKMGKCENSGENKAQETLASSANNEASKPSTFAYSFFGV
jgi:hypothetical protein